MDSFHHKVMENDFLYGKDQGINLLDKKSLEINRVLAQLQIWFFHTRPPPGYKWTITDPACKKSLPWGAVQGQSAVMYYRKWTSYCAMTRTEPLTPSLHLPLSSYPVLSLSLSLSQRAMAEGGEGQPSFSCSPITFPPPLRWWLSMEATDRRRFLCLSCRPTADWPWEGWIRRWHGKEEAAGRLSAATWGWMMRTLLLWIRKILLMFSYKVQSLELTPDNCIYRWACS